MEGAVQPGNPMVQQVPKVILKVKDYHATQDAQEEAPESGCFTRQRGGRPPQPLGNCGREDIKQVVVDSHTQRSPDVRPGDRSVRMEPVAVDKGPGGSQQVQHGVKSNQEEVGGDRQDHREERAPQEVMVVLVKVVPHRLQDQVLGLAPSHVVHIRHPG